MHRSVERRASRRASSKIASSSAPSSSSGTQERDGEILALQDVASMITRISEEHARLSRVLEKTGLLHSSNEVSLATSSLSESLLTIQEHVLSHIDAQSPSTPIEPEFPIQDLPFEVVVPIFASLSIPELCSVRLVNKLWNIIANDRAVWKIVFLRDLAYTELPPPLRPKSLPSIERLAPISPSSLEMAGMHVFRSSSNTSSEDCESGEMTQREQLLLRQQLRQGSILKKKMSSWKKRVVTHHLTHRNWVSGVYSVNTFPLSKHAIRVVRIDSNSSIMVAGDDGFVVRLDLQENCDNWVPTQKISAHRQGVVSMQFSGRALATGSRDNTIRFWDLIKAEPISKLKGHHGAVWALQFDVNMLCSGADDKLVCLWDLRTGKMSGKFRGHSYGVSSLQFNDRFAVTGSADKTIKVWDLRLTKSCLATLSGHKGSVRAVQFDSEKIVSSSWDGSTKIWKWTGECSITLRGHAAEVMTMQFDRRKIVTGACDRTVKVWDWDSGRCVSTFRSHKSSICHLAFNDDYMVSADRKGMIKTWRFSPMQASNRS